ncbi:hypothetical protein L596_015422 [Steinernema carpocapsae]|uniref:Uncharacterized protein n=1 Tax=Steinernema carpocapsae TaxID=34508 RepID=A0A4U5NG77_STECR|nr:hypothetical protein L596_015422 [Steinernema carpocapsae]
MQDTELNLDSNLVPNAVNSYSISTVTPEMCRKCKNKSEPISKTLYNGKQLQNAKVGTTKPPKHDCRNTVTDKCSLRERVLGGRRVCFHNLIYDLFLQWPRGAMDNASVYGTEDCRFESCRGLF